MAGKEIEDEGERKGRGKGGMDICLRGTKDGLWLERRQTWHTGKWRFIQVKGKPLFKYVNIITHYLHCVV